MKSDPEEPTPRSHSDRTVERKSERVADKGAFRFLVSGPRRILPGPVALNACLLAGMVAGVALMAWGGEGDDAEDGPTIVVEEAALEFVRSDLPVHVNERVERWIRRFLTVDRESFEHYLAREGLYGGMIRDRLRARDMPEELLYLAMIESGFSPWATSPVLASGIWQFMGPTARAYGLRIDHWVDERRDPIRATDAALDYLEGLHDQFGSWYLAAAAYNAGPARVSRGLSRVRGEVSEDDELYWEIIEHLPRETRQYVPKILAAAILASQAEHFGLDVEPDLPYLSERVLVPGGTSLARVAEAAEVPPSLMRDLNPHLVRGVTPPNGSYLLRVPQGTSGEVVAAHTAGRIGR